MLQFLILNFIFWIIALKKNEIQLLDMWGTWPFYNQKTNSEYSKSISNYISNCTNITIIIPCEKINQIKRVPTL